MVTSFLIVNIHNFSLSSKHKCPQIHVIVFSQKQESFSEKHTPSSWEFSSHCPWGLWSVWRVSYLSSSVPGSHLHTASAVSFSQPDDGERVRETRGRETQKQIIQETLINWAISPLRLFFLCFPSTQPPSPKMNTVSHSLNIYSNHSLIAFL